MNELNIQDEAIKALIAELKIPAVFETADPNLGSQVGGQVHLKEPINQTLLFETKRFQNKPASLIAQAVKQSGEGVVLVTDFINEQKAKALRDHDVEFFDVAGNIYLNRLGLHVWVTGKKYPNWEGAITIDTRAAFERTGLKVTYALITQPKLINASFRTIAKQSGVALGTVKRVIDSLIHSRYAFKTKEERILEIKPELIKDWAQAYINKLLPKVEFGAFDTRLPITDQSLQKFKGAICWGGETAADHYTGYLKPKIRTLYVSESKQNEFISQFKVKRPSPFNQETGDGLIQLRTQFWLNNASDQIFAHPLVVYADLLATNNARNTEIAEVIYDKHLKPLCE